MWRRQLSGNIWPIHKAQHRRQSWLSIEGIASHLRCLQQMRSNWRTVLGKRCVAPIFDLSRV
jgi:hypothetical protein